MTDDTAEIEITPEMIAAVEDAMPMIVEDIGFPEEWAPDVIRAVLKVFLEGKAKNPAGE